jgi:phosphate/sulfate permease
MKVARTNIYKVIIGVGTFALALAFAGNDLVNFIGVPIAAYQSYEAWIVSGQAATEFSMNVLASKVPTPTILLFLSGMVMVATLWLSKKARYVTDTEINLAREGEARERFEPNFLSRGIVRTGMLVGKYSSTFLPVSIQEDIDNRFKKPVIKLPKGKTHELPAFDMVRAAVNLMVAGILISIATSYKLPLSTTYVTFMVAMGTSLADRAWGRESAVYRVAGVLNVIGGWFLTAIIAFIAAGAVLTIISFGNSGLYRPISENAYYPATDVGMSEVDESEFDSHAVTGEHIAPPRGASDTDENGALDGVEELDLGGEKKQAQQTGPEDLDPFGE